jgi:hypothetical protein
LPMFASSILNSEFRAEVLALTNNA